jgi:hypothetical protein
MFLNIAPLAGAMTPVQQAYGRTMGPGMDWFGLAGFGRSPSRDRPLKPYVSSNQTRNIPMIRSKSPRSKPKKTRQQWAEEARDWQRKTVAGLIGLGKTLTRSKAALGHGEFGDMLRDDLRLDADFAQRVMKLARNPRFEKPANLRHLPAVLSTLLELDKMSETAFQARIATGEINPGMTAKQARKFITVQKVDRSVRITSVAYVRGKETPLRHWPSSLPITPKAPEQVSGTTIDAESVPVDTSSRSPPEFERLIARLGEIADETLEGDRLKKALDCLSELRNLLTTGTVVPFPSAAQDDG